MEVSDVLDMIGGTRRGLEGVGLGRLIFTEVQNAFAWVSVFWDPRALECILQRASFFQWSQGNDLQSNVNPRICK